MPRTRIYTLSQPEAWRNTFLPSRPRPSHPHAHPYPLSLSAYTPPVLHTASADSHSRCCRGAGTFIKFDLRHAMNMRALPAHTPSPSLSLLSPGSVLAFPLRCCCCCICHCRPRDSFRIVFFNMFVCLSLCRAVCLFVCLSLGTNNRVHH